MSKKTTNDLMAEELYNKGFRACSIDKFCANQGLNKNECIECIKVHFQQQADIPDGWEVVKEIKQMCEDEQLVPNYEEDNYEAGFNDAKCDVIDFINQKLQKVEIEVDNENE